MSCEPKLKWTSFPFAERPLTSFLLIIFLLGLSLFLWKVVMIGWQYPIFYFGGMLLVIISLLPYFIPTTYALCEDKLIVTYLFYKVERPWSSFGCFYADKKGIMLSTFKTPRRLDPFRGQSIRFSKSQEEKPALIEFLTQLQLKRY